MARFIKPKGDPAYRASPEGLAFARELGLKMTSRSRKRKVPRLRDLAVEETSKRPARLGATAELARWRQREWTK